MDEKNQIRRNIQVLKKKIEEGKVSLIKDPHLIESIKRVRYDAKGEVDLSTVNSTVRACAMAVAYLDHREELKETPLLDIQREYFNMLEQLLGEPLVLMNRTNATPGQVAAFLSRNPETVQNTLKLAAEAGEFINKFWDILGDSLEVHLEDLAGSKTIYGGDIFPNYTKNILSKTGLYIETSVLPDPVQRVTSMICAFKPEKAAEMFIKHGLTALSLKDIVLTDLDVPIAVIAPEFVPVNEDVTKHIQRISEFDTLRHLEKVFDREFQNEKDYYAFVEEIKSIEDLEKKTINHERILFDLEWKEMTFKERMNKGLKLDNYFKEEINLGIDLGGRLYMNTFGRMMQANDLLYKSTTYRGVPVIEAETSWKYLTWKYEYDEESSNRYSKTAKDVLVVNALQNEKLSWLGNIPNEKLIEFRQEGILEDLRKIFSENISEIEELPPDNFAKVANSIIENIQEEFRRHSSDIKSVTARQKKFLGKDIAPWIVTGGISIAASAITNIPLSVAASATSVVGDFLGKTPGPEVWKKGKEILKDSKRLKKDPIALLIKAATES